VSAVAAEHLTRRYGGLAALDDVSFEVAAGEVVALLGPNGAGKTTTMEILEGYQAPSGGTARVLGQDPAGAGRAWRARVGLVLQSTSLDPQLTVAEALGIFASLFPRPRPLAEVLELTDLAGEAGTRVGRLSGGQQRRVDVGIGIVGRPELLFLDEPTTGLDPAARRHAWTVIEGLTAAGTTVLLTTHYLEEAQRLADRVLVLTRGRLVADARPEQLRRRGAPTVIRVRCRPAPPPPTCRPPWPPPPTPTAAGWSCAPPTSPPPWTPWSAGPGGTGSSWPGWRSARRAWRTPTWP
jgi:ABC-2 type transport system ATP-binding protein